jgi:uncharacterized protein with HEPN domain
MPGNLSKDSLTKKFVTDRKTISTVVRELEIAGEATKQIPASVRRKYPDIPWSDMAGMRDKLIHFYFGVDMEIVWKTVNAHIPELEPLIENVLKELEHQ